MAEKNKVKFGLRNVHVAVITGTDELTGKPTYGEVQKFPGAVTLTLTPRGDMTEFYADNMLYYSKGNNQGYDGTFESAYIHSWFAKDVLGETEKDGVLVESANDKSKDFALMFEFDGDQKETRHVLYRCTASRPTINGATTTATAEPETATLDFVASARTGDMLVKARTSSETSEEVFNAWYTAPFEADTELGG